MNASQARVVPAEQQVTSKEFQTGQVLTIVGGHFVHDTYAAFAAPLMPLIIEKLSLSLTMAGTLLSLVQLPALLNPFIGYLADKLSVRYFVIMAPGVTATLMSILGLAPNYFSLAIILLAAGVSTAVFHAPAPAMIGRVSGARLGQGMSLFMAGGELGRTVGPLLAVWAVSYWTLDSYYRIAAIGWAASLVLFWRLRHIPARPDQRQSLREMLPAARRLFPPLFWVVLPRDFMLTSLAFYLPTFMDAEGASLWVAGAALSLWELAGVAGALTSGTLSDWLGRRTVLLVTTVASALLLLLFLAAQGWLLVPILLALGFTSLSATPVMLAMVQEQMPHNRATANGVFLAMTFLIRPVVAALIGLVGDNFGLRPAFFWSALLALLAIPPIFWLPQVHKNDK